MFNLFGAELFVDDLYTYCIDLFGLMRVLSLTIFIVALRVSLTTQVIIQGAKAYGSQGQTTEYKMRL